MRGGEHSRGVDRGRDRGERRGDDEGRSGGSGGDQRDFRTKRREGGGEGAARRGRKGEGEREKGKRIRKELGRMEGNGESKNGDGMESIDDDNSSSNRKSVKDRKSVIEFVRNNKTTDIAQ